MTDDARRSSQEDAINRIRQHHREVSVDALCDAIISGDRKSLSEAITICESTNPRDAALASQILLKCLPHSGKSVRVGITGVPGVGKSTFIDSFGTYLISLGKKVAVLAIDPSSEISRGSILGDKTRMERLSMQDMAFIRPSPSAHSLGGVARKTRESVILCEAAGFDVILIETVGVGQSETAVHAMTDFFLLLMLAGAGDQLQGIKRGIMEMCDGMLITKSDGDNIKKAMAAKAEYSSALHLFPSRENGWTPQVDVVSSVSETGIDKAWSMITQFVEWQKARGIFDTNRQQQDINWMHQDIRDRLISEFYNSEENKLQISDAEKLVKEGKMTAFDAASRVLSKKM